MVTRRRTGNKATNTASGKSAAEKTAPKKETASVIFTEDRRLTVTVGTSAEFGKVKVGLSLSQNVKDGQDAMELADSIFDELSEKLEEQFDKLADQVGLDDEGYDDAPGADEGNSGDEDSGYDDGFDDESGDDAPDDLTEDMILKMKKAELVKLIKEEELDLDPKDFDKIGDLRDAIIDAIFEPEGGDDFADDDWDD